MKQTKTKIIHLVGSLNPGGVQTYILNVSKYDTVYDIEREIWTLYQEGGLLANEFLKNNVKTSFCIIIPQDRNWKPYLLWKKLRNFAKKDADFVDRLFFNTIELCKAQESIQDTGAVSRRLSHIASLEGSGVEHFNSQILDITDMKTKTDLGRDETGTVEKEYAKKLSRQQRALWAKRLGLEFC